MSLINDALKRAAQSREKVPFSDRSILPLQPVDYASRPHRTLRFMLALLAVAALTFSVWFFWKWLRGEGESPRLAGAAGKPTEQPVAEPEPVVEPASPPQVIKVSTNIIFRTNFSVSRIQSETPLDTAAQSSAMPIAASPTNSAVPSATNAVPLSPFADLKLQSIIYREDKPAAVINGEMLFTGDEMRGARVLKIERQSVAVERNGETNELRLPRL